MLDFIVVPREFVPKEELTNLLSAMGGTWHESPSFGQWGNPRPYFEVDWYESLPPLDPEERESLEKKLGSPLKNVVAIHATNPPSPGTAVAHFIDAIIQRWGGYYEQD
jgi:hypothetical protein